MPELLYTPGEEFISNFTLMFPSEIYSQGKCPRGKYVRLSIPIPGSLTSKVSLCVSAANLCPVLSNIEPNYVHKNTHTDCSYNLRDVREKEINNFIAVNATESKIMCSSVTDKSYFLSESSKGAYCRKLPPNVSDEIKTEICSSNAIAECSWIRRKNDSLYNDMKILAPGESDACWWKKNESTLSLTSDSPCVTNKNYNKLVNASNLTEVYSKEELESKLIGVTVENKTPSNLWPLLFVGIIALAIFLLIFLRFSLRK